MGFCRFYGVSAVMLLLLPFDEFTVRDMASALHNSAGVEILKDMLKEIDFLVETFEKRCICTCKKDEDVNIYNQIKLNKSYRDGKLRVLEDGEDRSKVLREVRKTREYKGVIAKEDIMDDSTFLAEEQRLKYLPKYVDKNAEGIVLGPGTDRQVVLTDEQVTILQYISNLLPRLRKYRDIIESNIYDSDIIVFGLPWVDVRNRDAENIIYRVLDDEKKCGNDLRLLNKVNIQHRAELEGLRNIMTGGKGSSNRVSEFSIDSVEADDIAYFTEFKNKYPAIGKSPKILGRCYSVMNIAKTVSVEMFNNIFGLHIESVKEYENIFKGLYKIGVVGLDFHTLDFLEEFASTLNPENDSLVNTKHSSKLVNNYLLLDRYLKGGL